MYLTYDEYLEYTNDEGSIPEESFNLAEFKARKRIDFWTDNRIQAMESIPEAVKFCMLALLKIEDKFGVEAMTDNPVIASFNTDGYSESYGSVSEQSAAVDKAAAQAVRQWLYGETDDNGTPLLYRGVYPV